MDCYAVSMTSMVGSTVVELFDVGVNTHLGIADLTPFTASTAKVVVNNNAITHLHMAHARANLRHNSARLMPTSFKLSWVTHLFFLPSVAPEVTATKPGSTHVHDYLGETWYGVGKYS
jgi:hypothetical protein